MPSNKILNEKQQLAAALREQLQSSSAGVLVDYKGISVAADTKLRAELRKAGVHYAVVKNTMLRIAVKDTALEGITSVLEGSTAIAISGEDPLAAARVLGKYAEGSKGAFKLKAGYMDGAVLSASEVTRLANLPSREVLLSMLCSALNGNIRGLAVALKGVADKQTA